ncbi:MAG: hypothetical protein KBA95_15510 [Acidobacteria bacterium]|nr:hypothetical protein [Acidobacteriota bacterium]
MHDLGIRLHYGSPDGPLAADLTAYADSAEWRDTRHDNVSFSLRVPRDLPEAWRLYVAAGRMWVVVSRGGALVWVGRLHEPGLAADGRGAAIIVRALGRWALLDDLSYTALWSDTSVAGWEEVTSASVAAASPTQYGFDTNNRVAIYPQKDETFGNSPYNIGSMTYAAPHGGARDITTVSFSYFYNAGGGWKAELISETDAFGSRASEWLITATGSGTATITLSTPRPRIEFAMYYDAAPSVYAGETGAEYLIITNVRVKTTTAASVTADLIAADLAADYAALNPGVLASAVPIGASPGLDLTDELYEDAEPTAILARLGLLGDGAGTVYTASITPDGYLTFLPLGAGGRTWEVEAEDLELSSNLDDMANSVYAIYENASGRTLRTAAATSAASVGRYGHTRQRGVKADTTSATTAGQVRDVALSDTATAPGAADIAVRRVFTPGGGVGSLLDVRPGDTLLVRDLPLIGESADLDRLRSFRIAERRYKVSPERLTVTPETPLPRLDVLLAQRGR